MHSKATEDMLKTVSSTRIDLPSFARERKRLDKPLLADKKDWEGGDRGHILNMFPVTGSPGWNKFVGDRHCFFPHNLLSSAIRNPYPANKMI